MDQNTITNDQQKLQQLQKRELQLIWGFRTLYVLVFANPLYAMAENLHGLFEDILLVMIYFLPFGFLLFIVLAQARVLSYSSELKRTTALPISKLYSMKITLLVLPVFFGYLAYATETSMAFLYGAIAILSFEILMKLRNKQFKDTFQNAYQTYPQR